MASPNEDYAPSEEGVVHDTVRVAQDGSGTATVAAESNSAFFDPVSYEIECGGDLEPGDVSVKWTTLMGGTEPLPQVERGTWRPLARPLPVRRR